MTRLLFAALCTAGCGVALVLADDGPKAAPEGNTAPQVEAVLDALADDEYLVGHAKDLGGEPKKMAAGERAPAGTWPPSPACGRGTRGPWPRSTGPSSTPLRT